MQVSKQDVTGEPVSRPKTNALSSPSLHDLLPRCILCSLWVKTTPKHTRINLLYVQEDPKNNNLKKMDGPIASKPPTMKMVLSHYVSSVGCTPVGVRHFGR